MIGIEQVQKILMKLPKNIQWRRGVPVCLILSGALGEKGRVRERIGKKSILLESQELRKKYLWLP